MTKYILLALMSLSFSTIILGEGSPPGSTLCDLDRASETVVQGEGIEETDGTTSKKKK